MTAAVKMSNFNPADLNMEGLQAENRRLHNAKDLARATIARLQGQVAEKEKNIIDLELASSQNEDQIQELKHENDRLVLEISTSRSENADFQSTVDDRVIEISRIRVENEYIRRDIDTRNEELANTRAKLATAKDLLEAANSRVDQLTNWHIWATRDSDNLEAELATARSTISDLQDKLVNRDNSLSTADATIKELEGKLVDRNASLTTVRAERENLQHTLVDRTRHAENLETDLSSAHNATTDLQHKLVDRDASLATANDNLKKTRSTLRIREASLATARSQIEKLQAANTKAKADLALSARETQTLQDQLALKEDTLKDRTNDLADAHTTIAAANQRAASSQRDCAAHAAALALSQADVTRLRDQLLTMIEIREKELAHSKRVVDHALEVEQLLRERTTQVSRAGEAIRDLEMRRAGAREREGEARRRADEMERRLWGAEEWMVFERDLGRACRTPLPEETEEERERCAAM
ncbi:hypothetical protein SLS55_010421 [Diplodia seriata]|uniref:Uncharacterized protein n=1 Tax=Diplodia seriata TaxID=420778 RepID=A0ABR3BYF4_9PEZI